MIDPFVETLDEQMSRVRETTEGEPAAAAEQIRRTLTGRHVCPYCGNQNAGGPEPCPRCTMEDTPATRQATKARIGPWYVLQSRNPAAPGMRYATLLALINKGQITARSIIRGPSTHQLWRFAAHVRGVSREFGLCYSCGANVDRTTPLCPNCQRSQEPPTDPDSLLESRTSASIQPQTQIIDSSIEAPSYAARMRDLNRQRVVGQQEAHSAAIRGESPRRTGNGIFSSMDLAAALQDDPNKIEIDAPRRMGLKIASFLLVLIVGGTAALFYFQPDYRQPTLNWLNGTWSSFKTKFASITPAKTTIAPAPKPVVVETPHPIERLLPYSPPIAEPPRPTAEIAIKPPPTKAPAPQVAPPPVDPTAAIDQARKLWSQAIDCEARQDFIGATKHYEEIKKLPNEAWPAGLQLRLTMAQARAGQTSAQ
jgi:hypothetical protein